MHYLFCYSQWIVESFDLTLMNEKSSQCLESRAALKWQNLCVLYTKNNLFQTEWEPNKLIYINNNKTKKNGIRNYGEKSQTHKPLHWFPSWLQSTCKCKWAVETNLVKYNISHCFCVAVIYIHYYCQESVNTKLNTSTSSVLLIDLFCQHFILKLLTVTMSS